MYLHLRQPLSPCSQGPSFPTSIKLNWLKRRNKDTLLPIIRAQILPGTHVLSDKWKAYDSLQDEGYQHHTVNHSLNFMDPDPDAHTQGIGNTWWGVKRGLPHTETSKDLFKSYLHECFGISTMERIPLETSSSISPNFTRCMKTRKVFRTPIYAPCIHDFIS